MPSTDELQVVYKAIDQMTAVQKKILDTQEKMISGFTKTGTTADTAGTKMNISMKKGEKSLSSVEGQIAKINKLLGFMGVQLDTIDIYMISAFKVTALWKLIEFAKTASEEFTKLNLAVRSVASLTEYMGGVPADALASLEAMAVKHKMSITSLAQSYRNLVLRGYDLQQIEAVMDSLLKASVVLGTQAMMPVAVALERVTEGLLGQRSAATDNMNMTKNLEDMHKEFAATLGNQGKVLTDNIKKQGEVAYFTSLNAAITPIWAAEMEGLTGKTRETNKALEDLTLKSGRDFMQFRVYMQQMATALIKIVNLIINGWEQITYVVGSAVLEIGHAIKHWASLFVDLTEVVTASMKDIWNAITFKGFSLGNVKEAFSNLLDSIAKEAKRKLDIKFFFFQGLEEIQEKIKPGEGLITAPPSHGLRAPAKTLGATKEDIDWPENMAKRIDKAFKDFNNNFIANEKAAKEWAEHMDKLMINEEKAFKKGLEDRAAALREEAEVFEIETKKKISALEGLRLNEEISDKEFLERKVVLINELIKKDTEYLLSIDRFEDTAGWRAQANEIDKLTESLTELNFKLKETTGTFAEGITFGFKRFINEGQKSFQAGTALVEGILSNITTSLNTIFTDFRTRDLKSWHSYLTKFANMITDALQQIIVKMIVLKAIGASIGMFELPSSTPGAGKVPGYPKAGAGAVFHEGGLIERFHAGTGTGSSLKTDEIIAVLQTGERVLSRKQNATFESIGQSLSSEAPTVINKTRDLKSWQEYLTKFANMVVQTLQEIMVKMYPVEVPKGVATGKGIIERFHAGSGMGSSIKTDEILAILQTRERVLSRGQNTVFESLGKSSDIAPSNITPSIVNYFTFPSIDQSSVASFIYQNKDKIADALMTTMRGNHPFRR